jgi:hypothetical protein
VQYHAILGKAPNVFIDQVTHSNKASLCCHLVLSSQVSIVHIYPLHMDVLWHQALLQLLLLVVVMYFVLCIYYLLSLIYELSCSLPSLASIG